MAMAMGSLKTVGVPMTPAASGNQGEVFDLAHMEAHMEVTLHLP